jgi:FlaG/FlaF family flagellin (archaellin)
MAANMAVAMAVITSVAMAVIMAAHIAVTIFYRFTSIPEPLYEPNLTYKLHISRTSFPLLQTNFISADILWTNYNVFSNPSMF